MSKKRAAIAILVTCLPCWFFAYLATNVNRDYAFGLFIYLPFVLGAVSTLVYGFNYTSERRKLFKVSVLALLTFCFGMLLFAWEGVICLIMALPIGLLFTFLGSWAGYKILKSKIGNTATIIILLISVPSLIVGYQY